MLIIFLPTRDGSRFSKDSHDDLGCPQSFSNTRQSLPVDLVIIVLIFYLGGAETALIFSSPYLHRIAYPG